MRAVACLLLCACDIGAIAARRGCGLEGAAFCDGPVADSPGGRGGPLDERRWQVSRFSHVSNVPQGQINAWEPAPGVGCGGTREGLVPPNDVFVCDGRFHDAFTASLSFAMHDFSLRQPFDFAGRTGTVTFSLGGPVKTTNGWWPEVWLTEAPRQIPHLHESTGSEPTVERGLGIVLKGEGPCSDDERQTAVSQVVVVDGYAVTTFSDAQLQNVECFAVGDGVMNHFELRVSQGQVELLLTPPGGAARTVLSLAVSLPFTRGHLHLEQIAWGTTRPNTLAWADVGFDGPSLPAWVAYEHPDAQEPASRLAPGSINTGYAMVSPFAASFKGVELDGKTEAWLALTASLTQPFELQVRVNGGAWERVADPTPAITHEWRALLLPVPIASLSEGDNTIELQTTVVDGFAHVANVELLLR
ncbi:MAG: hypothetical protein JNK82_03035 [Myxococcaceae bacterium]|nr:hypothetical protein [Myxococcaceae bacterium]